ncbi:DUF3693 domain-containing protein [Xylella taiwanensis]|uniref:DUF3693 domain-containing protein n=2 Tax=Xylella taiwanensis TaxID=1444770 RepID=UPI000E0BCB9B|nr:DUF3693 domain-containing protein [Xylella taiwanensis]QKD99544.1 DUF3693 domain-containing protein [Xylella taiwanensis]
MGVTRQVLWQARNERGQLSDERIAQLCAMAKLDGPAWIAKIHAERAESPTERAMWKVMLERLSTAAALGIIGLGVTSPNVSEASNHVKNRLFTKWTDYALCEMGEEDRHSTHQNC